MISSQTSQQIEGFDMILSSNDADFGSSGLKTDSVVRISRLAVVNGDILFGSIGSISEDRMTLIRSRLAKWIQGT
jgi:mRNA interferase MazF